ncbi:MAG: sensor protein KdpD [Bacteroidia bacterium]|nr:sensor protein KdpD [Bacteroidia bacterium]
MPVLPPRSGRLKIYIGMSPGVGKTYRMLQEARRMLERGVFVTIGYAETHGRADTEAQLAGLPAVPRREVYYRGRRLEDMDLQAILMLRPEWVIVDELAHTNIPGSRHEKRWQDVMELLEAGIHVITAVNIQHIDSIHDEIRQITGVDVQERVPDRMLQLADEVVNIDLTVEELLNRLKEGKIYDPGKVETALRNFFQPEQILQLRELALKAVASQVERKIETELPRHAHSAAERLLACIAAGAGNSARVLRKTARLASYYNAPWYAIYVQTPPEHPDRIPLAAQRSLINHLRLATELGAGIIRTEADSAAEAILETVQAQRITLVCAGAPRPHPAWMFWRRAPLIRQLMKPLAALNVDLLICS